jgi:hypothetical protein
MEQLSRELKRVIAGNAANPFLLLLLGEAGRN